MIESRMPCPVCLGVQMVKESPPQRDVMLDLCRRCGGIWFEPGEFHLIRSGARVEVAKSLVSRPHTARCHACMASVGRDAELCPACGAPNKINCPDCRRPTRRITHEGIALDVCTSCRGVWFDRHELSAIWTLALCSAVEGRRDNSARAVGATSDGGGALLEALAYSPDVGAVVIDGSVQAAGSVMHGVTAAPEVVSVVGEAAGTVFEVLVVLVGAALEGV